MQIESYWLAQPPAEIKKDNPGRSPLLHLKTIGGSGWESNPPRPATRPATGFEDQEAHRDLTTPRRKDNRRQMGLQDNLSLCANIK